MSSYWALLCQSNRTEKIPHLHGVPLYHLYGFTVRHYAKQKRNHLHGVVFHLFVSALGTCLIHLSRSSNKTEALFTHHNPAASSRLCMHYSLPNLRTHVLQFSRWPRQFCTIQYCTVQYHTVLCSTVLCGAVHVRWAKNGAPISSIPAPALL